MYYIITLGETARLLLSTRPRNAVPSSPSDLCRVTSNGTVEYVRKADVEEDGKESQLQGLKEQLAASDTDEAAQFRNEIENLETRIDEFTEYN